MTKLAAKSKVTAAAGTTARWTFLLGAIFLILIALLLLLARIGLPWLGTYKGHVEARLSEQLKAPVVIDELNVRWEQFGPKLSAEGVSLSESTDRQVTLDEVIIDLDLLDSVMQRQPVIDELTLVGAKLSLESSSNGSFKLHGLKRATPSTSEDPKKNADMLSWLMSTDRVGLEDATITVINAEDQQELVIQNFNIVAINDDSLHQIRADMQLPEALGGKIEIGLDVIGDSDDIRHASADVHIKATDLKADAWRSLQASRLKGLPISTTGIARLDADVQLELWGGIKGGKLDTARGQLMVADVVDSQSQESVLEKIITDIVFEKLPSGWQLIADSLKLQGGGETTIVKDVVYQYKPADDTAWRLNASGESLNVELATKLALSLFDKDANLPRAKWLAEASPRGDLSDWNASFALIDGRPDFSLQSTFSQLELNAADGIPGGSRINGSIDMQHNIGKVLMSGSNIELDIPQAYEQALQLQQVSSELTIDVQDPLRTSLHGDVTVEDLGLALSTRLKVQLNPGSSPHIDMQGNFTLDDLGQASRYTPVRLLRPPTARWLDQALVAGRAVNGELLMFGHIADYPFSENEGVFKVGFDIDDATLKFLNTWPAATNLQGRFDMNGASIKSVASDGVLDAMRISQLTAGISDIRNPVLSLNTTSAGSLAELIKFGREGPLSRILKTTLTGVEATGRAQMDMALSVPLKRKATSNTVATAQESTAKKTKGLPGLALNGSLFLNNNDITYNVAKLDLSEVNGAIGFTKNGIRVNNLQGLMHGLPVRVDADTSGSGTKRTTEIRMAGTMRAKQMLDTYDVPLLRFAEGQSHWKVKVKVPMSAAGNKQRGIQIAAVSDLVGTRLMFPEPLANATAASGRLALSSTFFPKQRVKEWAVDFGTSAKALVKVGADGLESMAVNFGGGDPNAKVAEGFRLEGNVDQLGLDGWVSSIAGLLDDLPASSTPKPIVPISIDLKVNQFIAGKQEVGSGTLRFNTDNTFLNGLIESPWLSANLRYPREHWKQDQSATSRVTFIDKQFIDALGTADSNAQGSELDPRILPPIDLRIAKLRWDLLDLSDLTIRTSPAVSGLNIDTFGFAHKSAQLIGSGYWRLRDPQGVNSALKDQHVTKLDLTLQSDNLGRTATMHGFGGTLDEGEGTLVGSLVWPAPAYKPSLENIGGEMNIDIKKGRILNIEPGAAKIVGLFALSSIPRRLSLDFKDLVLDGLDYETIRGEVQLANGIAHASLVQLNGSVGVVDISGESNLIDKQYNQRITVLPRVSAALPIIGIISGGATAGLGALFAGGFLKAIGLDFDRIGLREYTLTGGWDSPELKVVPYAVPAK